MAATITIRVDKDLSPDLIDAVARITQMTLETWTGAPVTVTGVESSEPSVPLRGLDALIRPYTNA